MKDVRKVMSNVLKRITPSEEDRIRELDIANTVMKSLSRFKVRPLLVGSLAKETDLAGDKDIDIFILFAKTVTKDELEKRGLEYAKKVFKSLKAPYEIDYAEHPYVKGEYEGLNIEIVPCYSGKDIVCSVDRTPFHTEYIKGKLAKNPKLKGQIRLLKQFMKGCLVYGAESKVQGFSGYLAELLVCHYESFENVLKAVSSWKFGQSLDPERLWDDESTLKYFFTDAEFIVVDPTDKDRNAAAAVSRQKLAEFIVASLEFLKNPSGKFFFPAKKKAKTKAELNSSIKHRGTKIIAFLFAHDGINQNSLYSQLRRTMKSLTKEICQHDFNILKADFFTDENCLSVIVFEFEVWELPNMVQHIGPPIDMDLENQERFRLLYKKNKPYIKNGHWVVDKKRKYTKIEKLIPKLLKERKGFGKNLRNTPVNIRKNSKIVNIDGIEFRRFLDSFF